MNPHTHKCYAVMGQILFECVFTKRGNLGGQSVGIYCKCTYCTILWIKQVLHVIRSPTTSLYTGLPEENKNICLPLSHALDTFCKIPAISSICTFWYMGLVVNNLSQTDRSKQPLFICIHIFLQYSKGCHILYWWFMSRDGRSYFSSLAVSSALTGGPNPTDIISPECAEKEKQPHRCLGYHEY